MSNSVAIILISVIGVVAICEIIFNRRGK